MDGPRIAKIADALIMLSTHKPKPQEYDVVVVGAGHAGCEAANASAKMGCRTLLLTISIDSIAQLSCNPAIGGIAKGQVAMEVDALGGLMGVVTDASAIQYRLLNRGKGPAVQSPRAQCDRERYRIEVRKILTQTPNLTVAQGIAVSFIIKDGKVIGVKTATGTEFVCSSVVICAGTFLSGLIHIGSLSFSGGRAGEPAAIGLTSACDALGLKHGRLKTGTPPRIWGGSVDFSKTTLQPGDEDPVFFSFRTLQAKLPSMPCYITRTNERTAEVIRASFDRAPLFTGQIKSEGPRYCPSIELKLVRFSDKQSHLLFLEPEGIESSEYYLNGFATSIPEDAQIEAVRTVPGLENAVISRVGYAIEYDYFEPIHLRPTLESRIIEGVYFAGQINGTSGYEEAAGQGIVAGINAAVRAKGGGRSFTLDRAEAYIGVMIDDLITKGAGEPYRLFTSRAEHRLLLRVDNVTRRLMKYGRDFGLITDEEYRSNESDWMLADEIITLLREKYVEGTSLLQLLRRPGAKAQEIMPIHPKLSGLKIPQKVIESIEIEAKYEGYILKENELVERFRKAEKMTLPEDVDYFEIEEIRFESREKMAAIRPSSIGQAGRIPGVTPADIAILLVRRKAGNLPRKGGV